MTQPRPSPPSSSAHPLKVALLLFGSGLSALVYQTAWQRELRLVFGSSTAASAAVLAIFIGGAGAGSLLFGKRSDASPRPLRLYGRLELAIAALAAVSPFAIDLARIVYRAAGGTFLLGMTLGTALRLALAALVIGAPTVLMGGTLPSAARSAESQTDTQRRAVGWLYAANTLGAVAGATLCTLLLLETLGTRGALWVAALLNAIVAGLALLVDQRLAPMTEEPTSKADENAAESKANMPPRFVLVFAALSGFLFFWLELVWYRLLGPLLGGTVYTFGVILAVVLLGIGLGGLLYPLLFRKRAPSARGLALTAALEALFVAVPFALGDRLAVLALAVRPEAGAGLFHYVPGWIALTAIMAFPAALVAGVQYPLLVALLGEGRTRVGSHLGTVGAHNTLGAMVGSLAGGFLLVPSLGALGSMRVVVFGLLAMAAGAAFFAFRVPALRRMIAAPLSAALAFAAILTPGPSAVLRHTPIGAGRVDRVLLDTPAFTRAWIEDVKRLIIWQTEGRESSVAIDGTDGIAMVVNGKIDGNARGDASTQVMGGLLGALLHPDPKHAMVIGFGTGSSAGWLGKVPAMERVDVAELEPSMLEIGRRCAPVNEDVLSNPKVRVLLGDAREILPTVPARYDVVFSEPSNPYRAGVASLFTQEYYRAVRGRLKEGGLFLQWVQIYEIDVDTLRTIYATLASVFPAVETWYLGWSDLVLVASEAPLVHDTDLLRTKLAAEPYRRALLNAWRTEGIEGLFAHYVAGPPFARAIADVPGAVYNTDDRNRVEFGFARAVGNFGSVSTFFEPVRHRKEDRPKLKSGNLDFVRVAEDRAAQVAGDGSDPAMPEHLTPEAEVRVQALVNYAAGNLEGALAKWGFQEQAPVGPVETTLVAEGLAWKADDAVLPLLERHARDFPIEADVIRARYEYAKGRRAEAVKLLEGAFAAYRRDPWPSTAVMNRAMDLTRELGQSAPADARRLFAALDTPFSVLVLESTRRSLRVDLSEVLPEENACVAAFAIFEPHPPWDERMLGLRRDCYARFMHPLAAEASRATERRAACVGWRGWLTCL
ncbi:fused MFS/spermidine synthase [Polyangium sorediatum]|uniref:Fused MFS/spermidine synthase n=1 Tax=Polyangium sorediatum TaxID=889274 RepID=A0ABT6P6A0_9BACT|nr:fused MFS/spermidine synthase [Polyangium sorediatum]MDI1436151.1 fused MFS/spermidine synthase [Polyangium sorediatum]